MDLVVKDLFKDDVVDDLFKDDVVDDLTDATVKTEGLLPGQTPLRITNESMRGWNTIQGRPTEISQYEPSLIDRIKKVILRPFVKTPVEQIAHAQNIYAISKMTGLPPGEVSKKYESLTRELNLRDNPTDKEFVSQVMVLPALAGFMTSPVATGLGIASFMGLSEIENAVVSKLKKEPYKFMSGKEISDLLPDDTNEATKGVVDVLDFIGKAALAGGIMAPSKAKPILERFTKDIITTYKMPKNVYIEPNKIKSIFTTGKDITPYELDLVKSLGLSGSEYKTALKKGVNIEIPAQKITTIVDKPYWSKIKNMLSIKSTTKSVINQSGDIKIMPSGMITKQSGESLPYSDIAKQANVDYKGIQSDKLVLFTDPKTGSTLALPKEKFTPENIRAKVEEGRKAFEEPEPLIEEAKKYKSAEEFVRAKAIYYHGSPVEKMNFGKQAKGNQMPFGVHFTTNKDIASDFATGVTKGKPTGGNGYITGVWLDIKNPLDITKGVYKAGSKEYEILKKIAQKSGESDVERDYRDDVGFLAQPMAGSVKAIYPDEVMSGAKISAIKTVLKENNYDLVIKYSMRGTFDPLGGGVPVYTPAIAVLDPSIIKTESQLRGIWNKAHKKPSTTAVEKETAKQPWEMTREEWADRYVDIGKELKSRVSAKIELHKIKKGSNRYTNLRIKEYEVFTRGLGYHKVKRYQIEGKISKKIADKEHKEWVLATLKAGKPVPPEVLKDYPDIKQILTSSKTMSEAHQRLKKQGIDIPIERLKKIEVQLKGGASPERANEAVNDLLKDMKKSKPKKLLESYGMEGFYSTEGGGAQVTIAKEEPIAKRVLRKASLAHNWLQSNEETEPIANAIDDYYADMRQTIGKAEVLAAQAKNAPKKDKEALSEYLRVIDRNRSIDPNEYLLQLYNEGKISKEGYDAGLARNKLQEFFHRGLVDVLLNSKEGFRVKSMGEHFAVEYTQKNGKVKHKIVNPDQLERLQSKYDVAIINEGDLIEIKRWDKEKGGYDTEHKLIDFKDMPNILKEEEKRFIEQYLPYDINYVSHRRTSGSHWVLVKEKTASGEEETVGAIRADFNDAKNIANELKDSLGAGFNIVVDRHKERYNNFPSVSSPYDVAVWLSSIDVDLSSDEAQKILMAVKKITPLLETTIKDKGIPGFTYEWDKVIDNTIRDMQRVAGKQFKTNISKDVRPMVNTISNDRDRVVAGKYIDLLTSYMPASSYENMMSNLKPFMYFFTLWNSPTYTLQNMTEPLWAVGEAAEYLPYSKVVKVLNRPMTPEEISLYSKAIELHIIKGAGITEELKAKGEKYDIGAKSERYSSAQAFKIGLKVATELGIKDKLHFANRFLYKAKPLYISANLPVFLLSPFGAQLKKTGVFAFFQWAYHQADRLASQMFKKKWRPVMAKIIFLMLLSGTPFGKKLSEKTNNPLVKDLLKGGVPRAAFGVSSQFLQMFNVKGANAPNLFRVIKILASLKDRAIRNMIVYGVPTGLIMSTPGIGRFAGGIVKAGEGVKTYRTRRGYIRTKTIYKPKTLWEKTLLSLGFTPKQLEDVYEEIYGKEHIPLERKLFYKRITY